MDQFFIIENEVIFMGDPLSKLYEQIKYKEINMQIQPGALPIGNRLYFKPTTSYAEDRKRFCSHVSIKRSNQSIDKIVEEIEKNGGQRTVKRLNVTA